GLQVTTDQLDWVNPEAQQYPHNLLQPLPLIPDNRGRRVIPFDHFINNDLEYLQGGASSRKYTISVTKTKAADYGHIKWIQDLVPRKKLEEKRIEEEQAAKAQNSKIPDYSDDDDDYNSAITPNEPIDSLSIGDEHLNTILATESDEFIKSCVENLVPNPSESKGENGCDLCPDEDVLKKIFLNPLFEEEINSMRIDQHHFNAESDLIESLLNRDSSIFSSSSKIDSLLNEFASELTLLKSIALGIDDIDCHHDNEIRLTKRLLYDNSSPRPPNEFVSENSNADIEYFTPSPILVKDSDSYMEEIDLSFNPNDLMPPGIEDDDDDSEGDNLFLERLLHDDPIPRPDTLDFSYDVRVFLPFFTYPVTSSILLSSGSEDTIFDPGIHHFSSLKLGVSHRSGTFMKFNESPMEMLFSTCSPMDQ
nr:hypothetical protein [Tanacetum cinerariifolium]